jgi:hypothetical protein
VIRLAAETELERIAGRVMTESGMPVGGALVKFSKDVTGDGEAAYGPALTTDDEGRFGFDADALPGLRYQCSSE